MPTTVYEDLGPDEVRVWALGARTDQAGDPIPREDQIPAEGRLPAAMWTPGVGSPANAGVVTEVEPTAGMAVWVQGGPSSGVSGVFIVPYLDDTSNMLAELVDGHSVTIAAADATNPRIDQVWLVVLDEPAGAGSRRLADVAVRRGDPAASPTAPGPDAEWAAGLLLADVAVGASTTEIVNADITDQRTRTVLATGPESDSAVATDVAHVGLTQTFVAAVSTTFTPPAGWSSYRLTAAGQFTGICTDLAPGDLQCRVLIAGQVGDVADTEAAPAIGQLSLSAVARATALAGAVTVQMQSRVAAAGAVGPIGKRCGTLHIVAHRES